MRVVLNAYGARGAPGDVVEVDAGDALVFFGAAHPVDEQLEDVRQSILALVDGAAEVLPAAPAWTRIG